MFTDWKGDPGDSCSFMGWSWSVYKAKEILRAHPRESFDLEVDGYRELLKMQSGFSNNRVDFSVPIICVKLNQGLLPIDGWNRILAATQQRIRTIPAVLLNGAEAKSVRLA